MWLGVTASLRGLPCAHYLHTCRFYTGRQWQQRGNVVRFSTFEHIQAQVPTYLGYPSVQGRGPCISFFCRTLVTFGWDLPLRAGLYLDDQMSGYTICEIYNIMKALQPRAVCPATA